MLVGTLLKKDLGKAQMRPNQLANLSGVPRQKISEYLGKGRNPSEDNLKKMLAVLPRVTEKRRREYWKAHRYQSESTLAKRKGYGIKQKTTAVVRRLSAWYDVEVTYDHEFLEMVEKSEDKTYIEKLSEMDSEQAYVELMKFARSLKKEKEKTRNQNSDSPVALTVGCTVALMPKPTNLFPALRWTMNLNSFDVTSIPQLETMVDGRLAYDGDREFLDGTWVGENAATTQILRLIVREAGSPYYGALHALALQKMQERIQLHESRQEHKIDRVSVPLHLIIDLWQNCDAYAKGKNGGMKVLHWQLSRMFTFWLQEVIEWKINKEFAHYFEKMASRFSRSA